MSKSLRKLLMPGEYRLTSMPVILETLVGSCVAVCIKNIENETAAMNHFLLDSPGRNDVTDIGRYGTTATEQIIKKLFEKDPDSTHYRAQIFGGAAVLKAGNSANLDIGRKNLAAASEILTRYSIRITRAEVAGLRGRRIKFDTQTGTVDCRFTGNIPRKHSGEASQKVQTTAD